MLGVVLNTLTLTLDRLRQEEHTLKVIPSPGNGISILPHKLKSSIYTKTYTQLFTHSLCAPTHMCICITTKTFTIKWRVLEENKQCGPLSYTHTRKHKIRQLNKVGAKY